MTIAKRTIPWILIVVIMILGFSEIITDVIVKYSGEKIYAIVTKIPAEYSRHSQINLLVNGDEYEMNISSVSCRDGEYKVGQQVEVLKHPDYEELVWPESQPEFALLIIIGLLIYLYFFQYKRSATK